MVHSSLYIPRGWTCPVTYNPCYNVTQILFIYDSKISVLSTSSFFFSPPRYHWSFSFLHSSSFSSMTYSWNNRMGSLFTLTSCIWRARNFLPHSWELDTLCLSTLNNIPLSEFTTLYFSVLLVKNLFVTLKSENLWIKLVLTSLCCFSCRCRV